MRIVWFMLATLLLAASRVFATDTSAAATLYRADLLADVDVLQHAYEALHPGLYRYNTPGQMHARFDALRTTFDHDLSLADAYLAFSLFTAAVRCGHTYPNFYNQTDATQHALFERANRVPFYFRWLDGHMIVTRDLTPDVVLPRGTDVLSIDGVAAADVLAKLITVARADGSNDAKRRALLEVQGEDKYEAFDIYLALFYPQIGSKQTLRVRVPGSTSERSIVVQAQTYAQRLASRPVHPEDATHGWSLEFPDRDLAVLRMPDWALYNSKWDWKTYLQSTFEELKRQGIRTLVLDLRGNEGGLEIGDEILPHLIDHDLSLPSVPSLVRYRKVPDDLAPMLQTWDASFKDWGKAAVPYDARYYRLVRDGDASGDTTIVRPRAPHFPGRVYVLVDAANSSATFQFAQQIQRNALGTLVGQPTGGNQRGINGGAFFFLRLPHSNIELDLPLIANFPEGNPPDAGLQPDIPVIPTMANIVAGRDAEMAAVQAALQGSGH